MCSFQLSKTLTIGVTVITFGFSLPLLAQTATPESSTPAVSQRDSHAEQLLQQMSQTLQNTNAFTFKAETTTDEATQTGQKVQYATSLDVFVHRSAGLQANAVGDRVNRSFWYDGRSITLLDRTQNVYATTSAPANMDEALDYAVRRFGVSAPLIDLVFSNPYAVLTANIQTSQDLGLHQVAGKSCEHLAFTQELIDWQIWISQEKLLPCKVIITYKTEPDSPQFTAVFSDWNLAPQLNDQLFSFRPPPNASQIEFLPRASAP